jgi:hypothetical protein
MGLRQSGLHRHQISGEFLDRPRFDSGIRFVVKWGEQPEYGVLVVHGGLSQLWLTAAI